MTTVLAGWEVDLLGEALASAPSVLNTQPWSLTVGPGRVELNERTDLVLPSHDPMGRDRTISCGAAVVNAELVLRALGHRIVPTVLPDPEDHTVIARLDLSGREEPTSREQALHAAVPRRVSHRRPFAPREVPDDTVAGLVAEPEREDVRVRVTAGESELDTLAELLAVAGRSYQRDEGLQRELALWTVRDEESRRHGAGVPRSSMMPAGVVASAATERPLSEVPDERSIAERLRTERVLVLHTDTDDRGDHVRTGMALQRTWLSAVAVGLAGVAQSQPLQLPWVRAELAARLGLEGHPQVLLRIGYPAGPVPNIPRRSTGDVLSRR